jgi:hypothetical protein
VKRGRESTFRPIQHRRPQCLGTLPLTEFDGQSLGERAEHLQRAHQVAAETGRVEKGLLLYPLLPAAGGGSGRTFCVAYDFYTDPDDVVIASIRTDSKPVPRTPRPATAHPGRGAGTTGVGKARSTGRIFNVKGRKRERRRLPHV